MTMSSCPASKRPPASRDWRPRWYSWLAVVSFLVSVLIVLAGGEVGVLALPTLALLLAALNEVDRWRAPQ